LPQNDFRRRNPRFQGGNLEKNLDLVREVEAIARDKNIEASQLALAWVLSRGEDVVPIPGTKRVRYLEQNAKAPEISLSAADLARLENAFPIGAATGTRYPDMTTVFK